VAVTQHRSVHRKLNGPPEELLLSQVGAMMMRSVARGSRLAVNAKAGASNRAMSTVPFHYQELFDLAPDKETKYRKLTDKHVSTLDVNGMQFLKVEPEAIRVLSAQAFTDIAHLLRPAHLTQLSSILKDSEATENDKFVALELLKNANIASHFILPMCQDTGTAIVSAKRGQHVLTDGDDAKHLSQGVYDTYTNTNLRYSQVAPVDMYHEVNTKTNLPAQIDIYATKGNKYEFLFLAKGGGSANKFYLYQQTKALLNPASLRKFLEDHIKTM
jgi:fumarate hydratase class I